MGECVQPTLASEWRGRVSDCAVGEAGVRVTLALRDSAAKLMRIDPRQTLSFTAWTWQKMAENPLRNRRRGQSPGSGSQQSPTSTSQKLKEEEVVWGKTPDGEGRS